MTEGFISSAHIQIIQIFRAVLCNMFFASGKVISQQQVKHPGRFLHVRGQHLDQAAAVGAHRRLTPTLINKGYVYIAESPLYEINTKNKTYFAYTEPEKADILRRIDGEKYTIQRSKGMGENDPEMMWLTTMSPDSRRLIKVLPTDAERTSAVFDLLLGDNLQGRKEHIAEHGAEYLDDLDVS